MPPKARQIDLAKLQKAIDYLENKTVFKNHNELFEALAATKWCQTEGYSASFIYHKVKESLDTTTPIKMKTKAGRIRKGGMSEKTAPPKPTAEEAEADARFRSFAPKKIEGESEESENARLRREIETMKLKFSVYYRDDDRKIFEANPYSMVKCAGNGHPTELGTCAEAEPHYKTMIDGMVAAQKLIEEYSLYAANYALNPDDQRRIKEATAVLNSFFKATAISKLELTKRKAENEPEPKVEKPRVQAIPPGTRPKRKGR